MALPVFCSSGMISAVRWIYLFAIFLLLTLAGCASSGAINNASPILTGAPVSLDFALIETSSSLDDAEADGRSLNDKIIIGLRERQIFGSVTGNQLDVNSGGGIKVKTVITEIKKVSPGSRVWFGALAGQAEILVQVTVSDLTTGQQIQAFEVEGKSGASARSGTADAAIQQAAQRIVAQVVEITRRTSQ